MPACWDARAAGFRHVLLDELEKRVRSTKMGWNSTGNRLMVITRRKAGEDESPGDGLRSLSVQRDSRPDQQRDSGDNRQHELELRLELDDPGIFPHGSVAR
jgi:hypothetical protein